MGSTSIVLILDGLKCPFHVSYACQCYMLPKKKKVKFQNPGQKSKKRVKPIITFQTLLTMNASALL